MSGSDVVSTANDMPEMSVVRGVRGAGGVCEMGMCLASGVVGGERNGFEFTNHIGTGVWDMCLCLGYSGVVGGGGGVGDCPGPGSGKVVLCLCVCESGLFV